MAADALHSRTWPLRGDVAFDVSITHRSTKQVTEAVSLSLLTHSPPFPMDNPVDRMIRLMTLGAGLVGILVYTVLELL